MTPICTLRHLALFSSGHYFEAECTYTCLRVTIRGGRKSEFPPRVLVLLSLSLSVPGVKWVNLVRTVQSRHRDCASKSNWNIGNALPFRFHDFYSPSSAFALPSSTCTPTNFPRIPFLSLLRSPFFPFVPFFVLKPRQLVEHTVIKLESWNSEKSKQ